MKVYIIVKALYDSQTNVILSAQKIDYKDKRFLPYFTLKASKISSGIVTKTIGVSHPGDQITARYREIADSQSENCPEVRYQIRYIDYKHWLNV